METGASTTTGGDRKVPMEEFKLELQRLINRHSIENVVDIPDFILADMICAMIEAMGPRIKQTLSWHGCNSVCPPRMKAAKDTRQALLDALAKFRNRRDKPRPSRNTTLRSDQAPTEEAE